MAEETCLSNTLKISSKLSQNLEHFLEVNEENADSLKIATKGLYDFTYNQLPVKNGLSELVIERFDNEQIWQELELYNTGVIGELIKDLSHLLAGKEQISFKTATTNQTKNDLAEEDEEAEGDEGEEVVDEEEESDEELQKIKSRLKAFDKIANKNQIASDLDSDSDGDPDDLAKEFREENNIGEEEEEEEEEKEDDLEEKVQSKEDKKKSEKKKSTKATIVDDTFFKISEMDTFLKQQDALEMKKSKDQLESDEEEEEDIDIFQDIGSDKEENIDKLKFKDFFRGPEDELPLKRVRFSDDIEDDENNQSNSGDDDDDGPTSKKSKLFDDDSEEESEGEEVTDIIGGELGENKSSFELRQQRLQKKISQLEKASVADKSWQLSGEIGAGARPENSLLEEHVQFDSTLKLAPEITEESTKTLEDIIIQRIKDQAWDDVERKIKTADAAYEYKKPVMLDQEKSKQSLGDIYEKEYQKQQETQEETPDKDDPEHEEINKMMNSLFVKLDALSNFHFTPKIPIPDVKIVANLPSITMEEVAPVGMSENQLAAPKELLDPLRNSLMGKTERSISDRNKERKLKKKLKKFQWKEKEKKQKRLEMIDPDSLKTSKNKALRKLEKQSRSGKKVTVIKTNSKKGKNSSANFFNQLQNEVTHEIGKKKQTKMKTNGISSVQLKL